MTAAQPSAAAKAPPQTGYKDPLGHLDPATREGWRKAAVELRDRQAPPKRNLRGEQQALIRDFVDEALEPVGNDLNSCLASLANDDDVGAAYHLRRMIIAIKAAALAFKGLAT